jgi:hypothetical protein
VVEDGVLFADRSLDAFSPQRSRSRLSLGASASAGGGAGGGDTSLAAAAARDGGSAPQRDELAAAAAAGGEQLLKVAPKLLRDLEYFLNRELHEHGLAGRAHVGDPTRMRIMSEALDCYIEHCSTYRPLLAKLKSEYDDTLKLLVGPPTGRFFPDSVVCCDDWD